MATLRDGVMKRGNTWSYVIRVTDPATGKSKPKWAGGFPTEQEAKAARDEARVKSRRGEYVERSRVTVGEYLIRWLADHAATVKPKTMSGYREDLNRYVIPRIGGMALQSLRPATITKLYRDLVESGGRSGGPLAVSTVRHVHRSLRKALNDAVNVDRLIPSNPCALAKLPRVRPSEPGQVWTPEQLRVFLKSVRSHRLHAFFHLAAYTGARRGELLALRWSQVDLDGRSITLRTSTDIIDGDRFEDTPKGGNSRTIGIDHRTVAVLREHKARQATERLTLGEAWHDAGGFVFTRESGHEIYPDTPSNLMTKLIRRHNDPVIPGSRGRPREVLPRAAVQLPGARLHDLRHLHATTLLLAGEPVHVVAHRLGHSDPAITLRVYAHVIHRQAGSTADVFARAIDGFRRR
jgi:integrase